MKLTAIASVLLCLAAAVSAQTLSQYGLANLPVYVQKYVSLQQAIAARRKQLILEQGEHEGGAAGVSTRTASTLSPESAYRDLLQALAPTRSGETHFGLGDPLNPLPPSSKTQLQVAEQWLCPVLAQGALQYIENTLSDEVPYRDASGATVSKKRLDERVLRAVQQLYATAVVEMRLQLGGDTALVDAAVEKLFAACVVAPLLTDSA